MPELPDVEVFRQYFNATSLHQKIKNVEVRSRDILENVSSRKLGARLKGRSFETTDRYGKYLLAQFDDDGWLVIHFGMTGYLKYFKDMDNDPPHDRMLTSFSNDYHLAFSCQRKLGEIELMKGFQDLKETKDLGPDAMDPEFDSQSFKQVLKGRRGAIKPTLMNQQAMAGIGNVYSDEMLFQAGIHPGTKVDHLDEKKLAVLFHSMKRVLQTAIDSRADPDKFPESYITPHRNRDDRCPGCKGRIEHAKISGRTAYFCPKCQKKVNSVQRT